jgi:hypothetical protein
MDFHCAEVSPNILKKKFLKKINTKLILVVIAQSNIIPLTVQNRAQCIYVNINLYRIKLYICKICFYDVEICNKDLFVLVPLINSCVPLSGSTKYCLSTDISPIPKFLFYVLTYLDNLHIPILPTCSLFYTYIWGPHIRY